MSDLNQRIEAMYQGDKRGAWAFVLALWITVIFVLAMSWPYIPDQGVRIVALIAAAAVLIFNTASIGAMVKHYAEDKEFIYGLDINPIAVELARVSIWIHTFVRGLPMSSLDHNLVCANSLTGIGSIDEEIGRAHV